VVCLQAKIFVVSKETVEAGSKAAGSREETPCVWKVFVVGRGLHMTNETLECGCGCVGQVGRNFEGASPSPAR
jgi:hypothetical protein